MPNDIPRFPFAVRPHDTLLSVAKRAKRHGVALQQFMGRIQIVPREDVPGIDEVLDELMRCRVPAAEKPKAHSER